MPAIRNSGTSAGTAGTNSPKPGQFANMIPPTVRLTGASQPIQQPLVRLTGQTRPQFIQANGSGGATGKFGANLPMVKGGTKPKSGGGLNYSANIPIVQTLRPIAQNIVNAFSNITSSMSKGMGYANQPLSRPQITDPRFAGAKIGGSGTNQFYPKPRFDNEGFLVTNPTSFTKPRFDSEGFGLPSEVGGTRGLHRKLFAGYAQSGAPEAQPVQPENVFSDVYAQPTASTSGYSGSYGGGGGGGKYTPYKSNPYKYPKSNQVARILNWRVATG